MFRLSHSTFATNARKITLGIAYSAALLLCSISIARAQQLSIPSALNDSATLERTMPALAEQLIGQYRDADDAWAARPCLRQVSPRTIWQLVS